MKKLLFLLTIIPTFTFAQLNLITPSTQTSRTSIYVEEPVFVTENKTSPFLYNQWGEGYLIINDSIISSQKKIHFNLETGELIIGSDTGKSVLLKGESLTGFVINSNDKNNRRVFSKINSNVFENTQTKRNFYEIILNEQGSEYLIKDVKKYVFGLEKFKESQSNLPIEYKKKTNYYIKNNAGKYVEVKLNKRNVLKVLTDKSSEVKAFALSNNINFKREHDVVRVLDYYHTL
jgi:hypothetical protein